MDILFVCLLGVGDLHSFYLRLECMLDTDVFRKKSLETNIVFSASEKKILKVVFNSNLNLGFLFSLYR